jgi:hypothetical protein
MSESELNNREIIIEFFPEGRFMKVSAMDALTLTEIVIQGPVNAPKELLERNALKRLGYVLKKKGYL